MAEDISYHNTYMVYWGNQPFIYPNTNSTGDDPYTMPAGSINTGWHVIPTMLWKHFLTPRQWVELTINNEAYTVKGYSCTIYNPIPMTQQLAIQGTTAFTAFNNTIYTLGAQDDLYETSYFDWWSENTVGTFRTFNLSFKEGQYKDTNGAWKKTKWPIYSWKCENARNVSSSTYSYLTGVNSYSTWPRDSTKGKELIPTGVFWDPLNDANNIMELRPGKNSMSFSWQCHPCDENKWFNIDQLAKWFPYTVDTPYEPTQQYGPPGSYILSSEDDPDALTSDSSWTQLDLKNDPTIPNLLEMPIVPMQWFWQEIQKSIISAPDIKKPLLNWAGTEYECYKYGPTQCFIKGIPLFDDNDTHVSTTTQGCFRISLHLAVKKRRSRLYAPTWGPLSWRQIYSTDTPYTPSLVRYRTGGARRTWTNMDRDQEGIVKTRHYREDPYDVKKTVPDTRTTTSSIDVKAPHRPQNTIQEGMFMSTEEKRKLTPRGDRRQPDVHAQ
ncbi:VP1/VP2 [Tasmanian devil-associated chapparvovirus 2]|uniref:VP1/VP2 n=1 Tax=Tasmanian devil-associated chapparvovirus 2 TaxID=2529483 RepID=A0A481W7F8_9VIRU|nr:VP1/VP2 [Tasmanian devil-associated chapparvovirus 2]QBJ04588.1 VP1/VP2 [Tasmanian devil-associated chapparvovirus 2]